MCQWGHLSNIGRWNVIRLHNRFHTSTWKRWLTSYFQIQSKCQLLWCLGFIVVSCVFAIDTEYVESFLIVLIVPARIEQLQLQIKQSTSNTHLISCDSLAPFVNTCQKIATHIFFCFNLTLRQVVIKEPADYADVLKYISAPHASITYKSLRS